MAPMRVVIVGAGLSGLSLSAFLRRLNISSVVVDHQPYLNANYQLPITLWANALSCFRAFEVDEFFSPGRAEPEVEFGILNEQSEWMLRVPNRTVQLDPLREHDRIPSSACSTANSNTVVSKAIREAQFLEIANVPLRTTVAAKTIKTSLRKWVPELKLGKKVVDLVPHTAGKGGVHVVFDDGTEEWGDIVVGADGMHSSVRKLIYPQEASRFTSGSLNLTQIDGYVDCEVPLQGIPTVPCEMWGDRKSLAVYPLHHHGEKRVAFCATLYETPSELARLDDNSMDPLEMRNTYRAAASASFSEFGEPIRRMLSNAAIAVPTASLEVPIMPQWHNRRAVLLGDAAHGTFPSFLNHDASLCVEDASMLASVLANVPYVRDEGISHAFRVYEAVRRKRIERYVRMSRRARGFASTPYTSARNGILRVTPSAAAVQGQKWLVDWAYSASMAVSPQDRETRDEE